jgi:hypothetical protein
MLSRIRRRGIFSAAVTAGHPALKSILGRPI